MKDLMNQHKFDTLTEKNLRLSGNTSVLTQARDNGIDSDLYWVAEILKEWFDYYTDLLWGAVLYLESVLFIIMVLIMLGVLEVN